MKLPKNANNHTTIPESRLRCHKAAVSSLPGAKAAVSSLPCAKAAVSSLPCAKAAVSSFTYPAPDLLQKQLYL